MIILPSCYGDITNRLTKTRQASKHQPHLTIIQPSKKRQSQFPGAPSSTINKHHPPPFTPRKIEQLAPEKMMGLEDDPFLLEDCLIFFSFLETDI